MQLNFIRTVYITACLLPVLLLHKHSTKAADMRIFTRSDFMKTEEDTTSQDQIHSRDKRETSAEMQYLINYGYVMAGSLSNDANVQHQQDISKAIIELQRMLGLPETGIFDERTKAEMKKPRCGNPDKNSVMGGRTKRYTTVGSQWKDRTITYSINNFTPKIGETATHEAIDDAFRVWSTHAPLSFVKVNKDDNPDIVILFAKGYHNDNTAFDGEGGYLAHAYYPGPGIGGDTHFDLEEPWTIKKGPYEGNDLFLVAVHELGHALGLGHSPDTSAIMAPVYQYHDTSNFVLPQDDINGIQILYGRPAWAGSSKPADSTTTTTTTTTTTISTTTTTPYRRRPRPTPTTRTTTTSSWERRSKKQEKQEPLPDLCSIQHFDSMSFLRGEFYVFSAKYMWRRSLGKSKMEGPYKISTFWPELSSGVDAVFENPNDGSIIMIKGRNYYEYNGRKLMSHFPRHLLSMGLAEQNLDAGIWWHRNHKTYLFKGGLYWRLENDRVDRKYPKNISKWWPNIPNNLDAAFIGPGKDGQNHTYFVKGNNYWKFHSGIVEVVAQYETFKEDWLGCVQKSAPSPPTSGVSAPAIAAVAVVIVLLLVGLGAYFYRQKRMGYKYTQPDPRGPPPPYSQGYLSHIEEGETGDERYLWVKTFNHGWNNLKFSLQHKV